MIKIPVKLSIFIDVVGNSLRVNYAAQADNPMIEASVRQRMAEAGSCWYPAKQRLDHCTFGDGLARMAATEVERISSELGISTVLQGFSLMLIGRSSDPIEKIAGTACIMVEPQYSSEAR